MDVVLVVYFESTLVWVKYYDAYSICNCFESNKGVVEVRYNVALHRAGGEGGVLFLWEAWITVLSATEIVFLNGTRVVRPESLNSLF